MKNNFRYNNNSQVFRESFQIMNNKCHLIPLYFKKQFKQASFRDQTVTFVLPKIFLRIKNTEVCLEFQFINHFYLH